MARQLSAVIKDSRQKHRGCVQTKLATAKARFFSPVLHRHLLGGVSSWSILSARSLFSTATNAGCFEQN